MEEFLLPQGPLHLDLGDHLSRCLPLGMRLEPKFFFSDYFLIKEPFMQDALPVAPECRETFAHPTCLFAKEFFFF